MASNLAQRDLCIFTHYHGVIVHEKLIYLLIYSEGESHQDPSILNEAKTPGIGKIHILVYFDDVGKLVSLVCQNYVNEIHNYGTWDHSTGYQA